MTKYFSPRAWLSAYTNQNTNSDIPRPRQTSKTIYNVSKHIKQLIPSKSNDQLKSSNTTGPRNNKNTKFNKKMAYQDRVVFHSSNQRVQLEMLNNMYEDHKKIQKGRANIEKLKNEFTDKVIQSNYRDSLDENDQISKVKSMYNLHPPKIQIILKEDNFILGNSKTIPNQTKLSQALLQDVNNGKIDDVQLSKVSNTSKRIIKINEDLQIIHEERSQYERVNSNSTFKNPKQLQKQMILLMSPYEKEQAKEIIQLQKNKQLIDQNSEELSNEEEEMLLDSNVAKSPIQNYQSSMSVPFNQTRYQETEQTQIKKLYLSSLLNLYLQQKFQKNECLDHNLTNSIDRQLESGEVRIQPRNTITSKSHDYTSSFERLSSIPIQDSQKDGILQSIQSYYSTLKDEQSSIIKDVKIQVESRQDLIKQDVLEQETQIIKRLKVFRKPEVTNKLNIRYSSSLLTTAKRQITLNLHHSNEKQPQTIRSECVDSQLRLNTELQICNYYSERPQLTQNDYTSSMTGIKKIQSNSLFQSGRQTQRSRKGISLSKRSQQRIKMRSLQKQDRKQIKNNFLKVSGLKGQRKCKQYVRLGNKVIITLGQQKKPGIRVISEEKHRSKSKTIKIKMV